MEKRIVLFLEKGYTERNNSHGIVKGKYCFEEESWNEDRGDNFLGDGGISLTGKIWMPKETPKMLLQISHGMTEHIGRYEKLAEAMTARGVAVAGFDLRGHGQNGGDPKCASFGKGGWKASIRDMHLFTGKWNAVFREFPIL